MSISRTALTLVLAAVGLTAQTPQIQNAQVETRAVTSLSRDVAALTAQATTPRWVAWQVPMIDGERGLCCTYYSDGMVNPVRGCTMEPADPDAARTPPDFPAPTGPVQLEAGTTLTVYVRLVEGRIERMRVLSDDCPVDAGGREVQWLTGVSGADSVAFLRQLAINEALDVDVRSRLATAAVRGIALHRDPAAVATLIELASVKAVSPHTISTRREAMTGLGQSRDPRAVAFLQQVITR
jgi:hypothetical protein